VPWSEYRRRAQARVRGDAAGRPRRQPGDPGLAGRDYRAVARQEAARPVPHRRGGGAAVEPAPATPARPGRVREAGPGAPAPDGARPASDPAPDRGRGDPGPADLGRGVPAGSRTGYRPAAGPAGPVAAGRGATGTGGPTAA